MTKLPESLEKKAIENANKFYHAQGDITQVMPWSDCKESFGNGALEVKRAADKLAQTLKSAEFVITQSLYDGSMSLNDLEILKQNQEACFYDIQTALTEWENLWK